MEIGGLIVSQWHKVNTKLSCRNTELTCRASKVMGSHCANTPKWPKGENISWSVYDMSISRNNEDSALHAWRHILFVYKKSLTKDSLREYTFK